jgi:hypothetical protein
MDLTHAVWRKSSRSNDQQDCVEVAFVADAGWRKSSRSSDEANCVEVAFVPQAVAVRDSKNTDGPALIFPRTGWAAFIRLG